MHEGLKKLLSIARKTGDRCLVLDPDSDGVFVLMDLTEYERLLGNNSSLLTASRKPNKIEPDIASRRGGFSEEIPLPDNDSFAEPSEQKIIEDERFYLEPIE